MRIPALLLNLCFLFSRYPNQGTKSSAVSYKQGLPWHLGAIAHGVECKTPRKLLRGVSIITASACF